MIVLANGCFDLLHYGHVRHLQACKKLGLSLAVGVTKDAFVNKGEGRPIFNQAQRAEMILELRCVDFVVFCDSSLEALNIVKPDIFAKGKEYYGKIKKEDEDFCTEHKIRIVFTDEPTYSSTELLHHYDRSGVS